MVWRALYFFTEGEFQVENNKQGTYNIRFEDPNPAGKLEEWLQKLLEGKTK